MTGDFAPMTFELTTERLELRLWGASDADWYRELVGERGIPEPAPEVALAKVIEMRDGALDYGFGLLTVRRRSEGDAIGYCGLVIGRSTLAEPEIAFELFRRVHGHGYATEAARAVLDAAMATGRRRLWATVRADNDASFDVLEKLGFRRHHSTWDTSGPRNGPEYHGEDVWLVRDL